MRKIKLVEFSLWDFIDRDNDHLKQTTIIANAQKTMIDQVKDLVEVSHSGAIEIEIPSSQYAGFTVASLVEYFTKREKYNIQTRTYLNSSGSFVALINIDNKGEK